MKNIQNPNVLNESQQESIEIQWTIDQKNPHNWPPFNRACLSTEKRKLFDRNERVVILKLIDGEKNKRITEVTGVNPRQISRIINRTLTPLPSGEPAGWLGCVPNYHIKEYEAINETLYGGRMMQLLKRNDLVEKAEKICRKRTNDGSPIAGRNFETVYEAFKEMLIKDAGLDEHTDYPFTNRDRGREAVRNYADKSRSFVVACGIEYGEKAGKMARLSGKGYHNLASPYLPYESVQLDGHRLDALVTLTTIDEAGNEQYEALSRLWLLVLVDVSSRAVLGYHISYKENYSSLCVMNCIMNSLNEWKPASGPLPDPLYKKNAGLPGGVIELCRGRIFHQIRLDNAWSQVSPWLQERLLECGVQEIILNRPGAPRQNSVVERFMKTLEKMSCHQLPNTTGSNPADPIRRDPEKEAKRFKITHEHLNQFLDIAIANYNTHAHDSHNGRSPNEYIQYHLNQNHLPPIHYQTTSLNQVALYERDFEVTIRANKKNGHPPSVKFKGATYTSQSLRLRGDLANKKAYLRLNINDIRIGELFLCNGVCLGPVQVNLRWSWHPHSVADRQLVLKLAKKKKMLGKSKDPVKDALIKLIEMGKGSKKGRSRVVNYRQSTGIDTNSVDDEGAEKTKINHLDNTSNNEYIEDTSSTEGKQYQHIPDINKDDVSIESIDFRDSF